MTRLIARRLALVPPLLLLITVIAFGLLTLVPGDPAVQIAGEFASPDQVARIRGELGLDRSWLQRYVSWVAGVVSGDLGRSPLSGVEVSTQLVQRLPATLSLVGGALLLAVVVGVPSGALAGWRPGGAADRLVLLGSTISVAVPVFVAGPALVLLLALGAGLVPATGYVPVGEGVAAWAHHMILPAAVLSMTSVAEIARQTRESVLRTASMEHVALARANGLADGRILRRHVVRNSLIPVVTVIGLQLGRLFSLSVLVEQVFNIPGLGSRLVTAAFENDLPFIQGLVLVLGGVIVLVNAAVDISYGWINPKVRLT